MKVSLRLLVVWLMLLAAPLQGFAAARMLLCTMAAPVTMVASDAHGAGHDHAAMLAAQQEGSGQVDHGCQGGADCCVGAMLAYGLPIAPSGPCLSGKAFISPAPSALTVYPALPERPPKSIQS